MTVRIGWDEYEVALLIDACNRIRDNKIDKAECVHKLSNLLRQRAKANGINIDEVFRNENGIALQMTKMEYLLTDGKKGLPGASKLYIEMAKMSKLNSDEFEKILILAKEQIGYKEAMNNKNEFITVASKLLGMKIYRLMHKKTAIVLDKAVPLYKKFLQQSEKRSGIKIPDVEISTEGSGDNVEAKDNQSSDSKYSQIYQKLYYISKVYDDPNGMTLEKIMSMLGNGTDEELVISILNDVSWATKLADDIYSFGKNANSVLREQVQPYKIEEKDIVTDGQFFDFLYNYEKMAEASCRSYVSAIRTAEEYAKNHNYASHMIYDCGFEDASTLIRELMGDNEFLEFNAKQHNRFRAAFKKYLKMGGQLPAKERKSLSVKKTSLPVANEIEKVQPKDFDKSKFEITLLRRYRNGMQFDSIDFENFREMYDALFDETLTFDDEALEERLRYCGVLYKDRLFPAEGIIDNNTKETLFAYIDNCFSTGKSVLYYKAIYQDLSDAFASCFTLADEKMLKAYIEYSAEKDKYYYFSDYMSVDRNVKIDHTEEIEEYFLSAGKPMRLDDVFSTLSHIPQERVDRIIKTDSRFLRNSKGEYFHTDIFEITDDELENIAEIIEGFISEDEYAIWTNVWNMIQDKFPLFVENNLYLSGLGIRNAIEQRFSGRFRFEGAVISLPKDSFSMRDVYQLYAKHHAEFTADEIYILSKELDTVIYFDALSEVSVRVSHDLFVSKKRINFDVDSVDKVIESFMSKDYIRIREIDSFLAFPSVGYEWNEYMLESFLISYSKKFVLLNNGQSLHNVAGAIVKKDGKIKEFEDACAAVLSESRIELKKSEALNYLADVNMITRRSYKDLDTAMRKATQIRNRKE